MSNNKKEYFSADEIEEGNSLIKASSELEVKSLYQILIKNPYLVNTLDDKKETILSYSIKNKNIEVSNLILTSPIIDLDYQDKNGNTYLHLAVINQLKEIIKLLIEKGIYINKQNNEGNSALHLAYTINNKPIISILIDNGIDKNLLNKENKIAEEIIIKNKKLNSSLNNRIKVAKNKELNKKKDNKNVLEKNERNERNLNVNTKKKNSTGSNTNRNNKKENNINNNNGNNNKSITSSMSGIKMKVKTMPSKEAKKNNRIQNTNANDDNEEIYNNNNISIDDEYKRKNNNSNTINTNNNNNDMSKKYSEFEKTIKIDWDITKTNLNKKKENDAEIFFNYNYKEKKNSFGRDQDLCNVEDSNSFYNTKNDNISEKYSNKLKVNKKINNNNNKASIKSKKRENIKNKNRNDNNLVNSIGYNPCTSGEYTIKSEQRHSKNPSNIFGSKLDLSQSQTNEIINMQYNESKKNIIQNNDNYIDFDENNNVNCFHAFSGNFNKKENEMNINMIKNNPKRKTATSNAVNRNILISNKNNNLEDNNLNVKSSNMESSLITQSRLKTSHKKNKPLIEFLSQINLLKYLNNLDNNGFDDINLLIEEAKKGDIIKDQELKEAGINVPGDRAKILIRLKEKANIFGFTIPKSVYYTCQNFDDIENDQHIIDLNNWLSNLKVDRYLMNFVNNGYHSIELLLMQMETENPLTTEILRDEIGIDKIGYRSRILNKLKEEGRSLNNKLKTSVLVVNNRGDDKNCECFIF